MGHGGFHPSEPPSLAMHLTISAYVPSTTHRVWKEISPKCLSSSSVYKTKPMLKFIHADFYKGVNIPWHSPKEDHLLDTWRYQHWKKLKRKISVILWWNYSELVLTAAMATKDLFPAVHLNKISSLSYCTVYMYAYPSTKFDRNWKLENTCNWEWSCYATLGQGSCLWLRVRWPAHPWAWAKMLNKLKAKWHQLTRLCCFALIVVVKDATQVQ